MKHFWLRLLRLLIGLFLFSTGLCLTIQANLGRSPWDVLHHGISLTTGITIGQANIVMGIIVVLISLILKEKIGVGTILNTLLVGTFMDLIMNSNFIPKMVGIIPGLIMLTAGMFVLSVATYLYIGSGFYAGPRDLLMVSLAKKTPWPLGITRNSIEILAFIVGFFLGGQYGIGTLLYALLLGPIMQLVFGFFKFNVRTIKQDSLFDTIAELKEYFKKKDPASETETESTVSFDETSAPALVAEKEEML